MVQTIYKSANVVQVNVAAASGDMVRNNHPPYNQCLRPTRRRDQLRLVLTINSTARTGLVHLVSYVHLTSNSTRLTFHQILHLSLTKNSNNRECKHRSHRLNRLRPGRARGLTLARTTLTTNLLARL